MPLALSILAVLAKLALLLNKLDYAVFKTPIPPHRRLADIDILISQEHRLIAERRLARRGFRIVSRGRYSTTLKKASIVVDLYVHPEVMGIPYINGRKLLSYIDECSIDGKRIYVLEADADSVVVMAHAVVKDSYIRPNDAEVVLSHYNARLVSILAPWLYRYVDYFVRAVREGHVITIPLRSAIQALLCAFLHVRVPPQPKLHGLWGVISCYRSLH